MALLFLAMFASGFQSLRAQSDLRVGTWILNVPKSKYNSGPAPKSQSRIHEMQGELFVVRVQGVAADGSQIGYGYTYRLDGKDYPMTGPKIPYGAETVTVKQIDPDTFDVTTKKAGKPLVTTRIVYSNGATVLTMTSKGTDASGHEVNLVAVYDRGK